MHCPIPRRESVGKCPLKWVCMHVVIRPAEIDEPGGLVLQCDANDGTLELGKDIIEPRRVWYAGVFTIVQEQQTGVLSGQGQDAIPGPVRLDPFRQWVAISIRDRKGLSNGHRAVVDGEMIAEDRVTPHRNAIFLHALAQPLPWNLVWSLFLRRDVEAEVGSGCVGLGGVDNPAIGQSPRDSRGHKPYVFDAAVCSCRFKTCPPTATGMV